MESAILAGFIAKISARLLTAGVEEVFWRSRSKKHLKDLELNLKIIREVLVKADGNRPDTVMAEWLRQLEDVAYKLDDLLDESCARNSQSKYTSRGVWRYKLQYPGKVKSLLTELKSLAFRKSLVIGDSSADLDGPQQNQDESHSSAPKVLVGREDSKRTLIDYLIHRDYADDVVVVPIVGVGGVGKTTLAKMLFNCEEIVSAFSPRIWVDVGDDFHLKSILKKIVMCLTGEGCDHLETEPLKRRLLELISGKKSLIVMDNVWSDHLFVWSDLCDLFSDGAKGSRVIITTRERIVAEASRPVFIYELNELSSHDSWELFKRLAFRDEQLLSDAHVTIGKEILAKCFGIPLAIKAMGLLLCTKRSIDQWRQIKDKELVDINESGISILPVLHLSYNHLPYHLKMCFIYCGFFLGRNEIDVHELINYWMAQGLINESNEDVGMSYFEELVARSLLERDEDNDNVAKMHDLLRELCMKLSKGQFLMDVDGKNVTCDNRHIMLTGYFEGNDEDDWNGPIAVLEIKEKLRTLSVIGSCVKPMRLELILKTFKMLRYLNVRCCEISPSIGKLLHLRYLNLSRSKPLTKLPESITDLWHLQILKLDHCYTLQKLPNGMRKLVNLRELSLKNCIRLTKMPKGIGELFKLCRLSTFVVSEEKGSAGLEELCGVYDLRDSLNILNLHLVTNLECAILEEKKNLKELSLRWWTVNAFYEKMKKASELADEPLIAHEQVMNALKPHNNLQRIKIEGYSGVVFPQWLFRLSSLTELTISHCYNLNELPHLHHLRSLKRLVINYTNLEFIETCGCEKLYENLEYINIMGCLVLKRWSKEGPEPQFSILSRVDFTGASSNDFVFFPDASLKLYNCGRFLSEFPSQVLQLKVDRPLPSPYVNKEDERKALSACIFSIEEILEALFDKDFKTVKVTGMGINPDNVLNSLREDGWSAELSSLDLLMP